MQKEIIQVDNIKCGGCANSARQALFSVQGVQDVQVDLETGSITVLFEEENRRVDYIKALARIGYPEAGTSTLLQKGKSYISCAIGRVKNG